MRSEHYNLVKWYDIIESALGDPDSEPIVNIADEAASEYDAIFVGGGAGGRLGAAPPAAAG